MDKLHYLKIECFLQYHFLTDNKTVIKHIFIYTSLFRIEELQMQRKE